MKKFIRNSLLILCFTLFGHLFCYAQNISEVRSDAEITDILFNKNRLYTYCPFGSFSADERHEPESVKVHIANKNSDDSDKLTYLYEVSGGKIIGEGSDVVWELDDTRPAVYKITVTLLKNGQKSGESLSKSFEVREHPSCDPPCYCPSLSVSGGGEVKAGQTVNFTANISGYKDNILYRWKVSKGQIIKGQGTPNITVKTDKKSIGEITATVEIDFVTRCADCPFIAYETATVMKKM